MQKRVTKKKIKQLEKRETNRKFKEWANLVKMRDKFQCAICERKEFLNAHHIIPRENKRLRFEVYNGITLCPNHHKWSLDNSPHRNPFAFFVWFRLFRNKQYILLLNYV